MPLPDDSVSFLGAKNSPCSSTFPRLVLSRLFKLAGVLVCSGCGESHGIVILPTVTGILAGSGVWKSSLKPDRSSKSGAFSLGTFGLFLLPVTVVAGSNFCFANSLKASKPLPSPSGALGVCTVPLVICDGFPEAESFFLHPLSSKAS